MNQATLQHALQLLDARRAEGVPLIRQLASTGDPHALFALARLTWTGNMVPQDPVQGRVLFEYAAARGHTYSNLFVTNLLASGVAGRRDWAAAIGRLEAEALKLPERRAALDLVRAMDLDANGDPVTVREAERLSDEPDLRMFRQIFNPAECAYLIQTAEPLFRPSVVYNDAGEEVQDTIRTSDGAAFYWLMEDPAIHAINRRIASATRSNYEQGEALQVLRYMPGQEYRPHFDFLEGVDNPRPWTALIYLNDGYEGGATRFAKTGHEVRGRVGDMLVFRNTVDGGSRDPLAEHAGLPVTAGTKYLATRWIRKSRWIP